LRGEDGRREKLLSILDRGKGRRETLSGAGKRKGSEGRKRLPTTKKPFAYRDERERTLSDTTAEGRPSPSPGVKIVPQCQSEEAKKEIRVDSMAKGKRGAVPREVGRKEAGAPGSRDKKKDALPISPPES